MLATLERIDPHSDRIDMLVALVDLLRPQKLPGAEVVSIRIQTLCQLLQAHPAHAARLRSYLTRLLESRRHASLYTDTGVLSNDGFFTELKRRISYRFLPPALGDIYLADAIDQVLYVVTDYRWINAVPAADWIALYTVIAQSLPAPDTAPANPRRTTLLGMLAAVRTLSCRVCALGLEPRLIRSHDAIESFDSPFLMQNIEVNAYLDGYQRMLAGDAAAPEDARHLLVMLDQCSGVIDKVRRNATSQGTSVALTYLLLALAQSIDRLRKLLFLVDVSGDLPAAPTVDLESVANAATPASEPPTSLRRAGAIALAQELVEAHNQKYAVRELFSDNVDLLARNVTENASRTGEHYIADTRGELARMFLSSAGAGIVIAFMALVKILMGTLRAAPLVEAFLFSLNYSVGFVLIHMCHFTIATKQPAMTASRIASGLSSQDGRTIDIDSMAELITKVFRTQCIAVLGNIATVLPMAFLIAWCWVKITGVHLLTPAKAARLMHDIDPLHTAALFYAAIAGVCLFVAGLVSGYYDNKAVYTKMACRVAQLRSLRVLLGTDRLARLARYLENNLGGLMGNIYFGILLGTIGTLGYLFGLPIDVRHVTFSAGNFATAFVAMNYQMPLAMILTSVGGFLSIGAVNLLVSFALALWVALRARKVRFRQGMSLIRAMGRRFLAAPIDFFIGPKLARPYQSDVLPSRGTK
ncbi:MAG: site-specific recombinase [Pseudomonadota bacterium]